MNINNMKLNRKHIKIPIHILVITNAILIILGIISKFIHIKNAYNPITGVFQGYTIFNIFYNISLILLIITSVILALQIAPHYKRLRRKQPIIVGYSLFFVAIMFLMESLVGFYTNFGVITEKLIGLKSMMEELPSDQYIVTYMPLVIDVLCLMSAFTFYQMGMRYFPKDDEPQKPIMSTVFPILWATIILLYILIVCANNMQLQSQEKQVIIMIFTIIILYELSQRYYLMEKKNKVISLILRTVYTGISFIVVMPYLLAMLIKISDKVSIMPYFALFGISVYSICSTLHYVTSILFLQEKIKE